MLSYSGYSVALACVCTGGGYGPDDIVVTGVASRAGCQGRTYRDLTVTEVQQDPTGTIEVGDILDLRANIGGSCAVGVSSGDTVTVWGPTPDLTANTCNSFVIPAP